MKKPVLIDKSQVGAVGDAVKLPESKLFAKLPHLLAHISHSQYDDGTARTPGTVTFKRYGSGFTIIIKEPDAQAQILVSAPTVDECFMAANLYLGGENPPWEVDRYASAPRGGKRK